ncbi:hypothetical protein [Synechococcus sp. 65AY6Li]|nr:hypothetical protein [Synechococcus sp. 65AY6Li]
MSKVSRLDSILGAQLRIPAQKDEARQQGAGRPLDLVGDPTCDRCR